MVNGLKLVKHFNELLKKYPEGSPVNLDDGFRADVESICYELNHVEILYSNTYSSQMNTILHNGYKIITHFQNADKLKPLNNTDFIIYLKLSQFIENIKFLLLSEPDKEPELYVDEFLTGHFLGFSMEMYICDTYKSKLQKFKTKHNDEEIQTINEHFTSFLLEFLKTLSLFTLRRKDELEKCIDLLIEIADLRILVESIHLISHFVPEPKKIIILQKITNFCIKKNYNLKHCGFIKSIDKEFKFEVCAMSYFTLQHICNYLKLEEMHQTSKILSSFAIEEIISIAESATPNPKIDKLCEEAVNLITFKTYENIKVVPSQKIKKCLNILHLLLNSLSTNQHKDCSLAIVLLSMLSEFVMATDFDKSTIISLIDLVIGYLQVCKLPSNFKAVFYAFKMYQKCKSDVELEIVSINLCKSLSTNLGQHKLNPFIKMDMKTVLISEGDMEDKSIVVSFFLNDVCFAANNKIQDEELNVLFYTLNEHVLVFSQYSPIKNVRLIYPFSVSLNFSMINKDEDSLFNNLALLNDYLTIYFDENQSVRLEDNNIFLTTILGHYENISECLPDDFLIKCWEYSLNPQTVDIGISKKCLRLCSSQNLSKFIDILKVETMKIFEEDEPVGNDDFYLQIHKLWNLLLNYQFIKQKKKVRKEQVNHFCFILNKTFMFSKKIKNDHSLILLLKLVCSLLKLPWINKVTLMNCSLRIITFVEKSSNQNQNHVQLLTEAAELLIVLYKCPNNSIKPFLGLYVTTFANLLKKCWLFTCPMRKMKDYKKNEFIPFHKLEKCSSLFKQNKSDFDIICRYILEDLIELITLKIHIRDGFMRRYYNIIFNLMDVCSSEDIKHLMLNIQGPALLILKNAYKEYRSTVRFVGRL